MITAKLRNLRIAPRKVSLVADLIRGKSAEEAQAILNFTIKKAAVPMLKLLDSALANAKNNLQLDSVNLYISRITVDGGAKLKRWRSRARGTANEIQKKTSHINLVLDEILKSKRSKKPKKIEGEAISREEKVEKIKGEEKPKLKPETKPHMPKTEKASSLGRRIFRRKSF